MPRSLVLHQITVMDLPALEFVRMAGGSGCDAVILFTNSPDVILPGQSARFDFPAITSLHKREALSLLAGLTVSGAGAWCQPGGLPRPRYRSGPPSPARAVVDKLEPQR